MNRVEGKVALVTGAGRGIGRAFATRLAEEGADIVAIDLPSGAEIPSARYPMGGGEALDTTRSLVEGLGRRIVVAHADVRDQGSLDAAVALGMERFGHIDVVAANASILVSGDPAWVLDEERWMQCIDIDLSGAWRTIKAVVPSMIAAEHGGAIVFTSSAAGLIASPRVSAYSSAKHGVVGLMRALALELAPHFIRVNSLHPTAVKTDMITNPVALRRYRPDLENPGVDDAAEVLRSANALPVPWVEPIDVANALLWLVSDEARYITGVALPVDAGLCIK
jgi:SDR family mycofactocin-dependent oxidoreductase